MKRGLGVAVCLLATVVVAGIAGASALAAPPEFGRCEKLAVKPYTGGYSNSKCTTASPTHEGKYEWHPGAVKKFQTSSGGAGVLEEVGKYAVACSSESSTGEYSGTKEVKNVVVKFKGCKVVPFVCTSEGHEEGELVTVPLEGRVVWENEAEHKTALQLFPAGGAEKFIEFSCGASITVAVRGSILAPVKPDKMAETFKLKYKAKQGFQEPELFEEGGLKKLSFLEANFSGKGWDQAGQTITSTIKNEEKLELNAFV